MLTERTNQLKSASENFREISAESEILLTSWDYTARNKATLIMTVSLALIMLDQPIRQYKLLNYSHTNKPQHTAN